MANRTVLPNCCESWILQWGRFYNNGEEFRCLSDDRAWRKKKRWFFQNPQFQDLQTSIVFRVREIVKGFSQLEPEGAEPPVLNRCCSSILLELGPKIRFGPRIRKAPSDFVCPVCKTPWSIAPELASGTPGTHRYVNARSGTAYRIDDEGAAPFLESIPTSTAVP